jgi:hypothetical protein
MQIRFRREKAKMRKGLQIKKTPLEIPSGLV